MGSLVPMKREQASRFPIECPKCGSKGTVPLDRLDRQFTCRSCASAFYFHPYRQELVLGERPKEIVDPLKMEPPVSRRPDLPERMFTRWMKLKERTRTNIKRSLTALFLVGMAGGIAFHYFGPGPNLPEKLEDRAIYLAKAVVNNDLAKVQAVSNGESSEKLATWVKKVRPASWPKKMPVFNATAQVLTQKKKQSGFVRVVIDSPYNPMPAAPPPVPDEEKAAPKAEGEGDLENIPAKGAEPENIPAKGVEPPEPPTEKAEEEGAMAKPAENTDEGAAAEEAARKKKEEEKGAPGVPKPIPILWTLGWKFDESRGWLFDLEETSKVQQ